MPRGARPAEHRRLEDPKGRPFEVAYRPWDSELCGSSQSAPGREADLGPGPVLRDVKRLWARFNAIALPMTCSGVANLEAHDGAQGGEEAGLPRHLSAAG
ncbi:MAG TPA: hypothetical protein VKM54_19540 [Myxococcota bacterium]|nr:hypothetical protein [Myxococcota bacterium]